jgi:hypothetical protein
VVLCSPVSAMEHPTRSKALAWSRGLSAAWPKQVRGAQLGESEAEVTVINEESTMRLARGESSAASPVCWRRST